MNSKLKSAGQPAPADVAEQMAILRDDMRSLTETIAELAQAKGQDLSYAAKSKMYAARDAANAGVDSAKDHAVELQNQANTFVREQPAMALGIAAGLGFLFGIMSGRK